MIVVVKPQGVPTQPDESGAEDVFSLTKRYIKVKYAKPGEAWLGLLHRLDRPVGGIVVFARNSKSASRLSEQIRGKRWVKIYFAVVCAQTPPEGTAEDYLLRDDSLRLSKVVDENVKGAQKAVLTWQRIYYNAGMSLLRISLETGRHHQIRVQLASRGWPIWADARYGSKVSGGDIALWAGGISIVHPVTSQVLSFFSPPPLHFPWNIFN